MKKRLRSEFNSRQTMLGEDFEIFYYSDTHFQNVAVHTHDYYEFYFPAGGAIAMEIRGKRTPLQLHDVVIVPPGTRHRAVTADPGRSYCRYVFWISEAWYEAFTKRQKREIYPVEQARTHGRHIFHLSECEYTVIQSKLLRLLEEERSCRYGSAAFADLSAQDLLLTLERAVYEHDHPEQQSLNSDLFQEIADYMEMHLEEDLSLDALGKRFFVTKYHIVHLFKDRIGLSPHQFLLKKRLERCASEISMGKAVSQVYEECGFRDYSAFYRAFRNEYRLSPREYRNAHLPVRSG